MTHAATSSKAAYLTRNDNRGDVSFLKINQLGNRMRAIFCALSCFILTSTAVLAKAPDNPSPKQISEYQASNEKTRVNLLIQLSKTGQHELAANLLKRFPLTGTFAKNRTIFIEGLILHGRGNLTGAAQKYRDALASDPSLTLVRSELAQTLFELQEDDSAKHQLGLLMAEAPNEDAARGIRSFIDTIDARRPFTFNTYVSLAPSTNVNNGSSIKKVYLSDTEFIAPGNQKKSGIGFSAGASAGYSKRLGNDFSFVMGGSANAQIYNDKIYNTYGLSESAELRYLIDQGHLGLGMVASQSIKSDASGLSYYSYGPRIGLQKDLTTQDRVNLSSVYEWRNYPDNSLSDGTALMLDGSWSHAFSSGFNASVNIGFDRVTSGKDYDSYKSYSAGLGFYKELPLGITTNLHGQVSQSDFDSIFPIYNVVRKDQRFTGTVGLTKRDFNIWGYAPAIEYTYLYNHSNVANYEFDSHSVDFRLTKDF
jgi:outer membrane protein